MAQASRNTKTERRCPDCEGAGTVTVNTTNPYGYGPDPQCDEDVECSACEGEGWVRTVPVDPIEQLAQARRNFRTGFPCRSVAGMRYGAVRQAVVSPVCLPHVMSDAERDARAAVQNHDFVMGNFERLLGLAA